MTLNVINVGTVPNDNTGDPVRDAYIKCNAAIEAINNGIVQTVYVKSLSDLPTPVGGFHELLDLTQYLFIGEVTSADGLKFGNTTVVGGVSTHYRDKFIYTGVGVALNATNVLLEMVNLQVVAATGTFISKTGTGNFIIRRGIVSCKDFGMLDSTGIVLIDGLQTTVTNTGMKFGAGTVPIFVWSQSTITNSTTNDPLLDIRGASIGYSNLTTVIFSPITDPVAFCISADPANANIGQKFICSDVNFGAPAGQAILDGITIADKKADFSSNIGLADSKIKGNAYLSDNSVVTPLTQNTKSLISGVWVADGLNQRADVSVVGGRVTYVGDGIQDLSVNLAGSLTNEGGGTQSFRVEIWKNGTDVLLPHITPTATGTSETPFAILSTVTLAENEYIEAFLTNTSGDQDSLVRNLQISLTD